MGTGVIGQHPGVNRGSPSVLGAHRAVQTDRPHVWEDYTPDPAPGFGIGSASTAPYPKVPKHKPRRIGFRKPSKR